jgi:transposase
MKQQLSATPLPSYQGKRVYVGIDVHKRHYVVEAQVDQVVVKKWRTAAVPSELAEQLVRYFAGAEIHSVYEAGFSGFVLHRVLSAKGIHNIVVNAASVEVAKHSRIKTDQRDASKLATQLAAGRLRGIRIPSEDQEQHRLLSRTRQQLVKDRAALKNQIRMKAHQFGMIAPDERREMSHKLVQELLDRAPCDVWRTVVQAQWQMWKALDEQIAHLTRELQTQAKLDPNEATYRSVPGVGTLSARVLSNELGNLSQFANERELFSYTGLTPGEHSSGDTIRRGRITKQGNAHVRGMLIEVAWRTIRKDADLAQYFHRLAARIGTTKAIVAVARKLIGRIRAAFRSGGMYAFTPNTAAVSVAV